MHADSYFIVLNFLCSEVPWTALFQPLWPYTIHECIHTGLELLSNVSSPCPQERVLFTCSTSRRFMQWGVTLSNRDRTFQQFDVESHYDLGTEFTLILTGDVTALITVTSTRATTGILASTLIFNTMNTLLLNNAQIMCVDPQTTKTTHYRIAGGIYIMFYFLTMQLFPYI